MAIRIGIFLYVGTFFYSQKVLSLPKAGEVFYREDVQLLPELKFGKV